jgi:hypothetical protein
MVIKFNTWEEDDITIPMEEVENIEPCAFNEVYVNLKNGKHYTTTGEVKFI